jgi:hypothetical protein
MFESARPRALHNRSHEGRQPGRTIPATRRSNDGDDYDKTVVWALARTRGNAKPSYRLLAYQT